MEDESIIALYFSRDQAALRATQEKYGRLMRFVAGNILRSRADGEECINDVLLAAWNAIPPARPDNFAAWLCRIVRNLALKRYERAGAAKRHADVQLSLEELSEVLADGSDPAQRAEAGELGEVLDTFLRTLPGEECNVFVQRYWLFVPVKEIAAARGWSQSKVKSMLARTRGKLRGYLNDFYGGDV